MIIENNHSNEEYSGKIENLDDIYEMIADVKKANRHYASNSYMKEDELSGYIQNGKISFHHKQGSFLNLLVDEWDFQRVYFFIADCADYRIISDSKLVADVFCMKQDDKTASLLNALTNAGFHEYARFEQYSAQDIRDITIENNIEISRGCEEGFYDLLKECFDIYTDYIPEDYQRQRFFDSHICYSATNENHELIGGAIVTLRGQTVTEEFVFVKAELRNRGYSKSIRDYWMADLRDQVSKYISWVREDNDASSKYLMQLGFVKGNANKITMMRG